MKRGSRIWWAVFIIFIAWPGGVGAAPPMVLGDAEIVPYQHWEIWLSADYSSHWHREEQELAPALEIIYGLFPRVELGVEGIYIFEDGDGTETKGFDAIATQAKLLLWEEGEANPAICAGLKYEVPTDDDKDRLEWSENLLIPALAAQKHFGDILIISQVKYFDEKKWRYGADLMYKWDERLKLLAEVYAEDFIADEKKEKKDELNFRLGFKYKFIDNAKIYFAAGRSLLPAQENRPDFEANGGIMLEF